MLGDKRPIAYAERGSQQSGPSWNGPRAGTVTALGCNVNEDANEVEAFTITFLPTVDWGEPRH